MKNDLVSITIPTFQSEKTLDECLKAVFRQDYKPIEVVVIDSHSTDRTVEIAKKYPVRIISTEKKLLGSRGIGVSASKGRFVLLLDSDQILVRDAISRAVKYKSDMLFLGERSHTIGSIAELLLSLDRSYIHLTNQGDAINGVMLPRFFKRDLLITAFSNFSHTELEHCTTGDHALIYYETSKITNRVGMIKNVVRHIEPTNLLELSIKNYRYGRNFSSIKSYSLEHQNILRKKNRLRRLHLRYAYLYPFSCILLGIKGIAFSIGYFAENRNKKAQQRFQ